MRMFITQNPVKNSRWARFTHLLWVHRRSGHVWCLSWGLSKSSSWWSTIHTHA